MNKTLIKKYNTVLKVLAIHHSIQMNPYCCDVETIIKLSDEWIKNSNLSNGIKIQSIDLREKFKDKSLTNVDLNLATYTVYAQYNDGIGIETEMFWYMITLQNLGIKRKNDRLRMILKKQCLTHFEDMAIFLPNIEALLQSAIFKVVYSLEEQQAIFDLIEKIKKDWIDFMEKVMRCNKFKDIVESVQFYNKMLNLGWFQSFFQITDSQLVSYQEFYKKHEFVFC
jgi:hypothetical protein